MHLKMTQFAFGLATTLCVAGLSAQEGLFPIHAPPYTRVQAEGGTLQGDPRKGEYLLRLPDSPEANSKVQARGPFGVNLVEEVSAGRKEKAIRFGSGVISDRDPNPPALAVLPELCPRLRVAEAEGDATSAAGFRFVYRGAEDALNRRPVFQMQDPDAMEGAQAKTLSAMDGRNVLLLKKVRVTYDYEDSRIVDYESHDPKTGRRETLHEGMGGFYANFHYAIVPYAPEIPELPRQVLLSLAQGRLRAIGREALRPELRVHAFLPGPFLSKRQWNYPLCEWGDTEFQAPDQSLDYEELALWDWDYPVKNRDHILLIVWEEDEEGDWIRQGRIPPNHLMDDLVGVFEIRREDTLRAQTLRSPRGDFEITVETGQLAPALARRP